MEDRVWRKIDSAPKDRPILLYWPPVNDYTPAYVGRGMWFEVDHYSKPFPHWIGDQSSFWGKKATRLRQPTLWMPLPTPGEHPDDCH